jgi:hypothetical protein
MRSAFHGRKARRDLFTRVALVTRPGIRDEKAGTPEPKQSKTEHRVHGEHDVALKTRSKGVVFLRAL